MGAYSLAFAVAIVLAPAIGTAVYEGLGPEALWGGVGAVGVALALACLGLARWFRRTPAQVPGGVGGTLPAAPE